MVPVMPSKACKSASQTPASQRCVLAFGASCLLRGPRLHLNVEDVLSSLQRGQRSRQRGARAAPTAPCAAPSGQALRSVTCRCEAFFTHAHQGPHSNIHRCFVAAESMDLSHGLVNVWQIRRDPMNEAPRLGVVLFIRQLEAGARASITDEHFAKSSASGIGVRAWFPAARRERCGH